MRRCRCILLRRTTHTSLGCHIIRHWIHTLPWPSRTTVLMPPLCIRYIGTVFTTTIDQRPSEYTTVTSEMDSSSVVYPFLWDYTHKSSQANIPKTTLKWVCLRKCICLLGIMIISLGGPFTSPDAFIHCAGTSIGSWKREYAVLWPSFQVGSSSYTFQLPRQSAEVLYNIRGRGHCIASISFRLGLCPSRREEDTRFNQLRPIGLRGGSIISSVPIPLGLHSQIGARAAKRRCY